MRPEVSLHILRKSYCLAGQGWRHDSLSSEHLGASDSGDTQFVPTEDRMSTVQGAHPSLFGIVERSGGTPPFDASRSAVLLGDGGVAAADVVPEHGTKELDHAWWQTDGSRNMSLLWKRAGDSQSQAMPSLFS